MCLTQKNDVDIPKIGAFKVFTRDGNGLLQSVFASTFKSGLKYPSNERIRVDAEDSSFFAFALFEEAVRLARQGRRRWNIVRGDLIVLPVTLHEVVIQGKYHIPSDDPQCLDGYYGAYQSKEVEVHDTPVTRDDFHREVLRQHLRLARYSMSFIEKEAFSHFIPEFESVLQS